MKNTLRPRLIDPIRPEPIGETFPCDMPSLIKYQRPKRFLGVPDGAWVLLALKLGGVLAILSGIWLIDFLIN